MPKLSLQDAARQAAQDLVQALQNPAPAAPFHPLGAAQITALRQLAAIFSNALPRVDTPKVNAQKYAAKETPIPSQTAPDTPLHVMFETAVTITTIPDWYANAVIDPKTGKSLEYRQLIKNPGTKAIWTRSAATSLEDSHKGWEEESKERTQ
jgi:hypothetical protein